MDKRKFHLIRLGGIIVAGVITLVLELLRADILPWKTGLLDFLLNLSEPLYRFAYTCYRNVYEFAGNSFTQETAFFSAFFSITFFVIGRSKEGMLGVPLEELLDAKYGNIYIERRKKYVLISPLLVGACIILGAKLLAFYWGLLTLENVIFSARCATVATNRRSQERIALEMVRAEVKEISVQRTKEDDFENNIFVISDRYCSKTLVKIACAMRDDQNLLSQMGDRVMNIFFENDDKTYDFKADITYYNIEYVVLILLENSYTLDSRMHVFIFLQNLVQEFMEEMKEQNSEGMVYDSAIMAVVCGIILSRAFDGKKFIYSMFGGLWDPDDMQKINDMQKQKLCLLFFLEYLYHSGRSEIAKEWAQAMLEVQESFFSSFFSPELRKKKEYYVRYILLWTRKEKNLTGDDYTILSSLMYDIVNDDKKEVKSFIGGIIKGRKNIDE